MKSMLNQYNRIKLVNKHQPFQQMVPLKRKRDETNDHFPAFNHMHRFWWVAANFTVNSTSRYHRNPDPLITL